MWAPRRGQHELTGLGLDERSKLLREGHELRVLKELLPERPSIIVALKAPQVNELMQFACVADEVANAVLRKPSGLQSGPSLSGIEPHHLRHLPHSDRICAFLVDGWHTLLLSGVVYGSPGPIQLASSGAARTWRLGGGDHGPNDA